MNPILVLLCVIALGLLIGRVSFRGISLGTSAILFVALLAGHYGWTIPTGFGTLGLALFVYCVGISAGPTFFRGLASHGRAMAITGSVIVLTGVAVTWTCARLLGLPAELAGGLMAGAMTSTPALGAITQSSSDPAAVAVGFGVAYPIGIIAVVLFVQIAIKLFAKSGDSDGTDSASETSGQSSAEIAESDSIGRRVVRIANPVVSGKRPSEIVAFADSPCQMSRVQREGRWRPTPPDYQFEIGDDVMLVGGASEIRRVSETLGELQDTAEPVVDADRERRYVVVTSPEIYGRTLKELRLRSNYGVTIVRVQRHDVEFVPSARTRIEFGDGLVAVGEPDALAKIANAVGHRPRTVNETDLLSLVAGIVLGIFVGNLSLQIGEFSMSLGIAGGPLMVGLILGHFRRLGPIRGSYPPAAMLLMTEGGLALFLADAGLNAGANVVEVLMERGVMLCVAAAAIAIIPLLVGFAGSRYLGGRTLWQSLGATCGGMTSTPGLAVLTGATDSSQPATSYVAAYPVALVLITVAAPWLVELIG
ncbi:aspartate:alanine exchanger family transporter [Rhodopirellula europaea]|uniref:aspartate:alanine exchanger family transporter n=1 Tax=Rhodopirellula europaea TaxID=1263866 RepID=UPI003D26D5FC|tara:strand:- start:20534 stop:22138 length:1605 start_codon:yes stop_codon:yes gene_type:complete